MLDIYIEDIIPISKTFLKLSRICLNVHFWHPSVPFLCSVRAKSALERKSTTRAPSAPPVAEVDVLLDVLAPCRPLAPTPSAQPPRTPPPPSPVAAKGRQKSPAGSVSGVGVGTGTRSSSRNSKSGGRSPSGSRSPASKTSRSVSMLPLSCSHQLIFVL